MLRRFAAVALLAAPFAPSSRACDLVGSLLCDETFWFDPYVTGNDVLTYPTCAPGLLYDGDDVAVGFVSPITQRVLIETRSGAYANDPDVLITRDTCTGSCVAAGVSFGDERVDFEAIAGVQYFIQFDDALDPLDPLVGWDYGLEFDVWCSAGVCDPATDIDATVTCSTTRPGSTGPTVGNELKYYDCPDDAVRGFDPLWQTNPEAIYAFRPQTTGEVTFRLTGMSNDQDLYILADRCDPTSCIAASTDLSTNEDWVTFQAEAGRIYYVVVEGYEGPGTYTLDFDNGGGGCPEDCTNGVDDDLDGRVDCADPDCQGEPECGCDNDGDGYDGPACGGDDCDDGDPTRNPGRSETCNGIDDDCDGLVDEDLPTFTWYLDEDDDGYGTGATSTVACRAPADHVAAGGDCDDGDPRINPGATEICDDIDQDCDGWIDEGLPTTAWYPDGDGDGWGAGDAVDDCAAPAGHVGRTGDCDDTDGAIHPDATDGCNGIDDDCDGAIDEDGDLATWYEDADQDGFGGTTTVQQCTAPTGYVGRGGDCDDADDTVHPAAREVCNAGVDDDCDGLADDEDPDLDPSDGAWWYADADADGSGDPGHPLQACARPAGHVADADDCDDRNAARTPGRTERCDGVDNDCDGTVDEETGCYDDDGDGATEASGDCDDADRTIGPAAPEVCNGIDDDCDGTTDEGTGCYDDDGDGFTEDDGDCNDADPLVGPNRPEVEDNGVDDDCDGSVDGGSFDPDGDGYTERGGDCVEGDPDAFPGAPERPNGQDDDCDGLVDEGTRLYDDDGDGVSEEDGDCDDADPAIHPGADEPEDGVDNDCNGLIDDGGPLVDDDGDGLSEAEGDCDDGDPAVRPGADERDNGADDDCDGLVDEDFEDLDRDGVTTADGDCDDTTGWVRPGLSETCDGLDNDCNGTVDDGCDVEEGTATPEVRGCTCDAGTGSGLAAWPLALVLVGWRRRRRPLLALAAAACNVDTQIEAYDGRIAVAPGVADAGTIAVGDEAIVALEILHLQGPPVTVRAVDVFNLDGDHFSVAGDLPVVSSQADGRVEIRYAPTEAGWHRAAVTVISDAGETPEVEILLRGHATDLLGGAWPLVVDFGDVAPGEVATREIAVANDGDLPWTLLEAAVPAPFDLTAGLPVPVAPGDTARFRIRFAPTSPDPAVGTLLFDAGAVPLPPVTLRGNACDGGAPAVYDDDGDGVTSCGGDCDDTDPAVHPGAPETHDLVDEDCDGLVDEGTAGYDDDGDGTTELEGDCNDADPNVGPAAPEVLGNGIDDDCDGVVDLGSTDLDADGVSPAGGDCDDQRADVRPGAPELPDGADNDCDGLVDEGTRLYDDDGDGFCEAMAVPCSDGSAGGDCDDTAEDRSGEGIPDGAGTFPGNPERPDGRDNDCDGLIDEGTRRSDDDGDGYTEIGGDCDDGDPAIHPSASEIPGNGVDDDCDPATPD